MLDTKTYQVEVEANKTAVQAIINDEPTGTFTLTKYNSDKSKKIEGVKYRIWNDNEYDKTFTTDSKGEIKVTKLKLGKYYYQELETVDGYLIDNKTYSFTLKYKDQNTEVVYASADITNDEPTGSFTITKYNSDKSKRIEGVKYRIWNDNGYDKTFTTDNKGEIKVTGLKLGKYYYQEKQSVDGYLIDNKTYSFTLKYKDQNTSVVYGSADMTNDEPTGSFTITKYNSDKSAKIEGVKYRIWNDNGYDKTFTTDSKGEIKVTKLKLGKYYYQELETVNGYLIDNKTYSFTLKYKDQNTAVVYGSADITNDEPTGEINITKIDTETGNENRVDGTSHHGEASIKGATYTLYASSDIYNVAGTIKYFSKDEEIARFIFNEYGVASVKITNTTTPAKLSANGSTLTGLPLGNFYSKETIAPKGYTKDTNTYTYTLSYKDSSTKIIKKSGIVKNKVEQAPFEVIKITSNNNAVAQTVEGAEFTAILSKYVDYYGSFDEAKKHLNEFAKDEYSIFKTASNGHGISSLLAYGEYVVNETYTPSPEILTVEQFYVTINKDSKTPVKELVANDLPFEAYIKLQKQDKKTGKFVTYSGATFELYKLNEDTNEWEQVECKVGDKYFKTWTTNSEGVAKTETKLEGGSYKLLEVRIPTGFLQLDRELTFKVDNRNSTLNYDKDFDAWITVTAQNEQPTATLKLNKKLALREDMDKTMIKDIDFTKISFELVADENIIDYADGATIYEKGQVIGKYNLKEDGSLTVTELPMGNYHLKELTTVEGAVLDETEHKIVFEQKDTVTKEYIVEADIENNTTAIEISKTDITGEKELVGAKLTITDENNEVIDSWVSTEKTHKVEGLQVGKSYVLTEEIAPEDFVKATSVKFTVENKADIQKVVMIDKQVTVSKEDIGGKEVEGAELKVVDKDGNVVDSWISTKEVHKIKGLIEGENYTLYEDYAPDGFVISNKIEFTVTTDKEIQEIKMIDKIVEISKIDISGKEIENAKLQILDKDNNIIDEWISGKQAHRVSGLKENETYTLHEELASEGYVKATDIQFTVTTDKETQKIEMIDKIVSVIKTDIEGNIIEGAELSVTDENGEVIDSWTTTKEPHYISGLEENKKYILHELYAPEGFVMASDTEIIVSEDKETQGITLIDKVVEMTKKDISGDELEGAKMQVLGKDNNVIDEWTSSKEPHRINNLVEGESYILHEEIASDGYVKATDIKFIVTTDKETQKIEMIDKIVSVIKTDIEGNIIEGAELSVTDENGEVIDSWTTTKEPHYISGLEENKKYILHELYAPEGFVVASDTEIIVSEDKETQDITLIDKVVEMTKKDINGNDLEGATMVVTNNKTKNIVDKWVSTKEPHKINGLMEGETYILHEEIAIEGYVKATDIEFTVNTDKETQKIEMIDKVVEIVKTDLVTGEEIEGAKLQVVDEDENVIDEWVSTKEPHRVTGLEENKNYKLIEKTAPYGYELTEEINFTVSKNKKTQRVVMKDKPILQDIKLVKVDSNTKEVIKDKFTFGIYEDEECTKLLKEVKSNKETGTVLFKNLRYGNFYIKELVAPKAYILSDKVIKVEINDKGVFIAGTKVESEDFVYTFEFENVPVETPETSDNSNLKIYAILLGLSIIALASVGVHEYKKRKSENKK